MNRRFQRKPTGIKAAFRHKRLVISVLLLIPWLIGCATIQDSSVQTFSIGVSAAKGQTDTAFQAITDLTSPSIVEYAASQPTLNDANFLPVLDPQSIAVWDEVFTALQKYSQNLVLLTSTDLTKSYEGAAVNLATEVKQAGNDLKSQKLIAQGPSVSPSFAAAFTELGDLLLRAKAQSDARKAMVQCDPSVRVIFNTMADTIGESIAHGLRGTVHAHWEQLKAEQKVAFLSAKISDRQGIASKYASLLNNETTQDLALASLRKSLLALADAHHALATGNKPGVVAAVSTVEQEAQNTLNLSNRFQAISKASKN